MKLENSEKGEKIHQAAQPFLKELSAIANEFRARLTALGLSQREGLFYISQYLSGSAGVIGVEQLFAEAAEKNIKTLKADDVLDALEVSIAGATSSIKRNFLEVLEHGYGADMKTLEEAYEERYAEKSSSNISLPKTPKDYN